MTEVVAYQLCWDCTLVTPDKSFRNDLEADSLDEIELVMALEDEFGIELDDEALEEASTVQQAIDLVKQSVA